MSSLRADLEKLRIPLEEIILATENFSAETKIREGRLSVVYEGVLSKQWENRTATFKLHKPNDQMGKDGFLNELTLMAMFNHKNIIPFIGYCDEGDRMITVSEHAINTSLDQYLEDADKSRYITWAQRLNICLGAARGIKYLHSGLGEDKKVIHRNIKSSNIWLYDNLEAKICGFCLSIILPRNQPQFYDFPVDTYSYMDPIYKESGILKTDSDLYSFGVVLFEMLSGMPAYHTRSIGDVKPQNLMNLVRRYYDVGLDNLIDPHIRNQIDSRSLHMVKDVAYKCISFNIRDRPTIDAVIKTIEEALEIHNHGAASIITIRSRQHQNPKAFLIPLEEIRQATQGFSLETRIGFGRYGKVYRGQLSERENQIAAIKVRSNQGTTLEMEEFLTELEFMSSFHHENIIPFIGYCYEGNEMIIVTQYASKGSLADHLRDPAKRSGLTWIQRLKICLGVARGLKYLHSDLGERGRVIHRDPNSSNILLNDNLEAKLCDFGLSILIPRNQPHFYELALGTNSYIDPIYLESGFLKAEADVYTFGVVLFEMLSGVRANSTKSFGDDQRQKLMHVVRRNYDDGLGRLIDTCIKDQVKNSQSLDAFTQLAYECVSFNIKARPSMIRIVKRLEAILLHFENHGAASATSIRSHENQNLEELKIPIEDIRKATKNFSPEFHLRKGGFGSVYKGQLSRRTVAMKCLSPDSGQGKSEFLHELRLNFRFHHENIIPFIGYCDEGDEKIIITEYAINGSLDDYLDDAEKRGRLSWKERLQICLGAAKGLEYLHSGHGENNRVIHRDIKSGNILLDENLVAKICDFGMSKLDPANQPHTGIYTKAAGTNFYRDPIYQESGKLRVESDVYSLGVVMFEMLSGLLAYHQKRFGEGEAQFLINLVRRYYASGVDMLMDPLIRDQTVSQSFLKFQELAYGCINMNHKERPTMEIIIDTIEEALYIQENSYLQPQQLQGLSIGSSSEGNDQQDKK